MPRGVNARSKQHETGLLTGFLSLPIKMMGEGMGCWELEGQMPDSGTAEGRQKRQLRYCVYIQYSLSPS